MNEILKRICKFIHKPKVTSSMYINGGSFIRKYILGFVNTYCIRTGMIRFSTVRYDVVITAFKNMTDNETYINLFVSTECDCKMSYKDLIYNLDRENDRESLKEISYTLYKFMISNPHFDKIMCDEKIKDIIKEVSVYVEEHLIPDLIKEVEGMGQ